MTDLLRTSGEILARLGKFQADAFTKAQSAMLAMALPLEQAQGTGLVATTAVEAEWLRVQLTSVEAVRSKISALLPEAWRDANECRGRSARRNMQYLAALIWLLGPEFDEQAQVATETFDYYGKAVLMTTSEDVGYDWQNDSENSPGDNGVWPEVPEQENPLNRTQALKALERGA